MKLFHVSPKRNRDSIAHRGLLLKKAKTAMRVVWLCDRETIPWAYAYTRQRHRLSPTTLIDVWEVNIADAAVKHIHRGLYFTRGNVSPVCLQLLEGVLELAEVPYRP